MLFTAIINKSLNGKNCSIKWLLNVYVKVLCLKIISITSLNCNLSKNEIASSPSEVAFIHFTFRGLCSLLYAAIWDYIEQILRKAALFTSGRQPWFYASCVDKVSEGMTEDSLLNQRWSWQVWATSWYHWC